MWKKIKGYWNDMMSSKMKMAAVVIFLVGLIAGVLYFVFDNDYKKRKYCAYAMWTAIIALPMAIVFWFWEWLKANWNNWFSTNTGKPTVQTVAENPYKLYSPVS